MKVQYDRNRDGFTKETDFSVQDQHKEVKTDISGIAVKIGLCAGVLILAFVMRAIGVGKSDDRVATVSSNTDTSSASENQRDGGQQIGSLHYVETGVQTKWTAPVMTNDIELLRDGQVLRFTATEGTVCACMEGDVLSLGEDAQYGKLVRIQSDNDRETLYYGFETVAVSEGDRIRSGDVLGTVAVGRSIYFKVLEKGEPQDPTAYVDLSLH